MSGRVLTAMSAFAALALLLFLGWRALAPADPGAPPTRATQDTATAANASPGGNPATSSAATSAPVRDDGTAPATGHRLARIVDENDTPVANAAVAFDLSEELCTTWRPFAFDVEERLAAAPRYHTATDGIVALPTDAAVAFVIARAGERFGHAVIEFDSSLHEVPELRIAPDRTLRIVVVGRGGEPRANVPVEVTYQDDAGLVRTGTATRVLPRTEGSGCTTLWHAQTLHFWDRTNPTLDLRPVVFGGNGPATGVRLADPLPERIVLECPDHGGIRIRAWLADGVPNRVEIEPWLGEADGPLQSCEDLVMPGASPAEWVLFPVALARRWSVAAPPLIPCTIEGPTRHGDEVLADLLPGPGETCVTALLLRPDGRPCCTEAIVIRVAKSERHRAVTDGSGRIAFPWMARAVTFEASNLQAHASVDVPAADPTAAPIDLGIVALQADRLLVAGRVEDAVSGQPVCAIVRAFAPAAGEEAPVWLGQMEARADGTFAIHGDGTGTIEIKVAAFAYTNGNFQATAGVRDLVVRLEPARCLRATVLVDPDIAIEELSVQVRGAAATKSWSRAIIERGRFHGVVLLPDGDDLVLEVVGADDLPPMRSVPMAEWTAENGAFAATVDLRGALASVLVTFRPWLVDEDYHGWLYVREASRQRWASLHLTHRVAFPVLRGTTLDAIASPDFGMCVRATLHAGANTIDVPPLSVVRIDVTGVPEGVARTAFAVHVWRLVRREPLLDELVASGLDSIDQGEVWPWPRTVNDLDEMDGEDVRQELGEGPIRFELRRRGSYVAVPYVIANKRRVPLLDAAVAIEITTPGAVVETTIHLDPEKVRAALR